MDGKELLPYVLTVSVMIVLVMIAGVVLYLVRGRLFGREAPSDMDRGGVLETMRAMRDRGEISEEEYRTTQAALVAKAAGGGAGGSTVSKSGGPTKVQTGAVRPDELRAEPGFDLTGDPLPPPVQGGSGDES